MPEHVSIMVVDDDEGHAELIRRNLRRAGIANQILSFQDGKSALDYILMEGSHHGRQPNGPLLVLLDINMPGLDGVEVLRRIKEDPVAKKIPVIMLTTTDDPREVERCYQLGCSMYIPKPVDSDRFVEAIKRLGFLIAVVRVPSEDNAP